MGERVSELLWEADVSHPSKILRAARSFFYSFFFLIFAVCLAASVIVCLRRFTGRRWSARKRHRRLSRFPGLCWCLLHASAVHAAPRSKCPCDVLQGYPGSRGDAGEPVSILSYLDWTDRRVPNCMSTVPSKFPFFSFLFFLCFHIFVQFIFALSCNSANHTPFFHFSSLKSRVAKEPLDPKEMMESPEIQALMWVSASGFLF